MKVFAFGEFLKKENGASAKRYLNYLRQQNNTSTLPAQIINKFTFDSLLAKNIFLPRNLAVKNLSTGKERKSKGSISRGDEKHSNVCIRKLN